MKGKFTGENKSCGFKTGKVYEVCLTASNNNIILVEKESNLQCPYSSMNTLLNNWILF